jgi:muconolactone delta-isomerase
MSSPQAGGTIDACSQLLPPSPAARRAIDRHLQEEGSMPRIVITHAVQDVDRWLGGKAERAASLPGATNVTDLVAMDGSNQAAVAFDIDDLDTLKAVLSSVPPEMAAQAESHGVIVPTMTAYTEA